MYAIAFPNPIETIKACDDCGSHDLAETLDGFVVCRACGVEQEIENLSQFEHSVSENGNVVQNRRSWIRGTLKLADEGGVLQKTHRSFKNMQRIIRFHNKPTGLTLNKRNLFYFIETTEIAHERDEILSFYDESVYFYQKLKKAGFSAPSYANILRVVLRLRNDERYSQFGTRQTSSRYLQALHLNIRYTSFNKHELRYRQMSVALSNRFPEHAQYFTPLTVKRALTNDLTVNRNVIRQVQKYIARLIQILKSERETSQRREMEQ